MKPGTRETVAKLRPGDRIRVDFRGYEADDEWTVEGIVRTLPQGGLRVGTQAFTNEKGEVLAILDGVTVLERTPTEEELLHAAVDSALRARDPNAMMPTSAEDLIDDLGTEGYRIMSDKAIERSFDEYREAIAKAIGDLPLDDGSDYDRVDYDAEQLRDSAVEIVRYWRPGSDASPAAGCADSIRAATNWSCRLPQISQTDANDGSDLY